MLGTTYSCLRMIASIHRGLYDSWLFGFFNNDDPSTLVKPEYVATVMVGKSIAERFIKNSGSTKMKLRLEARANHVASHCFITCPLKKRSVPSRSSRNGHERIDISVFDNKISLLGASKAIIELKLSGLPCHLKPDLLRNKIIMELKDSLHSNQLKIACLGFIVVDKESLDSKAASSYRENIKKKYEVFSKQYASSEYITHVSVRELSSPPNEEDNLGVFIHMASVVISFIRC